MRQTLTNESIDIIIKKIFKSMFFLAIVVLIAIAGNHICPHEYHLFFNISLLILGCINIILGLTIIFLEFMKIIKKYI